MSASPESREVFVAALERALAEGKKGVQRYFETMGELLLRTAFASAQ